MATIAVTIIPTIRACAAPTLEDRIAFIKRIFSNVPRWMRNNPPAQSAPFSIPLFNPELLDVIKSHPVQKFSVVTSGLPKSPTKFLQDVSAPTKRDRNLIALMEVTKLSKGQKPTIKDRIFMIVDSSGPLRAEEIAEFLPTSPYKTVTSRISEMVKDGILVVSGKCHNDAGIEVSVYTLPKGK